MIGLDSVRAVVRVLLGRPRHAGPINVLEARQAIMLLTEVFEHHGATAWIDFGTLLGAVRTGGFIPWDGDIDWSCRSDEMTESLVADLGRVLRLDGRRSYWVDGLPGGIHAFCGSTPIAIQPWRQRGERLEYLSFLGRKKVVVPVELVEPLRTVVLEGMTVRAPGRAEDYLGFIYGDDWRTPDPSYIGSPQHRRNQRRWLSPA